jgi:hypothetical protein
VRWNPLGMIREIVTTWRAIYLIRPMCTGSLSRLPPSWVIWYNTHSILDRL